MCARVGYLCVIAAVAGCGGPPKSNFPVPLFPGDGQATLSSHRCQGGVCACRKEGADDEEQVAVPEGKKRWELRLTSSPGPAWVVVDGHQLRKGNESSDACWYVDLSPGDKVVQVQGLAEAELGVVGVSLTMNEYDPEKVAWYRGAFVSCGLPSGGCSVDELREIGQLVETDRRQLTDPCGTARVSGLKWRTGRVADGVHPGEVSIGFTLTVSGRVPESAPEDPSCPVK